MPIKAKLPKTGRPIALEDQVRDALARLEKMSTKTIRQGMTRYGIVTADKTLGVSMANVRMLAKSLGRDHKLAEALWNTRVYEARMLTAFVGEPERVTAAQMDRWARGFDNWATCDALCFHLFDRTPHAFAMVEKWSGSEKEFVKRAAFALLASLALHRKELDDAFFIDGLPLIERAATDERNFVKKGVSWALRGIGKRRSPALKTAALKTAKRLAASSHPAARWIGKDAQRELMK